VFEFPEEPAMPAPADVEPVAAASSADAAPLGAPGRERLELAIAYLDLGDADTARALLQEVATGGDIHSQIQARELLARLP
jgi:pilus assembly protein FimV